MILSRNIEEKINSKLKLSKPILLLGARQIGKTTVCKKIAEKHGDFVYINLEQDPDVSSLFNNSLDVNRLIFELSNYLDYKITENTHIIIDEIQQNSRAITALKYFCEDARYKVIGTGSNLGITLFNDTSSFPVGKVSTIMMYQLTFDEYLVNSGNKNVSEYIINGLNNFDISLVMHKKCLELFDMYLSTGGMPELIVALLNKQTNKEIKELQTEILNNYKIDFIKYADPKLSTRIRDIYSHIDIMLNQDNQKFRVTKIDASTFKTIENPLNWLYDSGAVIPVYKIDSVNLPLRCNIKENNFKLFFSDTSFLLAQSRYDYNDLLKHNDKIYNGLVIENYVAIVLTKYFDTLFYYQKKTTEIDYIIYHNNKVIPIEVKSGYNTKSRSLGAFLDRYKFDEAYKFTRKELSRKNNITNYPLYCLDYLFDN